MNSYQLIYHSAWWKAEMGKSVLKQKKLHTRCEINFRILLPLDRVFPFPVALRPNAGHGLLIHEVSRSHTTTHRNRQDFSGRVISSSRRPLPDNTQHSKQTDIHAPGGIRTHDLRRRAAADLRLRPRGYWDRQIVLIFPI